MKKVSNQNYNLIRKQLPKKNQQGVRRESRTSQGALLQHDPVSAALQVRRTVQLIKYSPTS